VKRYTRHPRIGPTSSLFLGSRLGEFVLALPGIIVSCFVTDPFRPLQSISPTALGFRIFGVVGVNFSGWSGLMWSSWPVKHPGAGTRTVAARCVQELGRFPGRGPVVPPGQPRPLGRTAPQSPAPPSLLPSPLATGRNPMNVATYVLYCVGCHSHGLIRADARRKGVRERGHQRGRHLRRHPRGPRRFPEDRPQARRPPGGPLLRCRVIRLDRNRMFPSIGSRTGC
jgi:hypothetical protein